MKTDIEIAREVTLRPIGEIAAKLGLDRKTVNHALYTSPLMRELCYQDSEYRWHGIVRQDRPHAGLQEFAGYYSTVGEFMALSEDDWLEKLTEGCINIGRNLNDTRGLLHSFADCGETMRNLFRDLEQMTGGDVPDCPQCGTKMKTEQAGYWD